MEKQLEKKLKDIARMLDIYGGNIPPHQIAEALEGHGVIFEEFYTPSERGEKIEYQSKVPAEIYIRGSRAWDSSLWATYISY